MIYNCRDCPKEAQAICQVCHPKVLFCHDHGTIHRKSVSHRVEIYDAEESQLLQNTQIVKVEIEKQIIKIQNEVSEVITELKRLSNKTIRTFKEINKNIQFVQAIIQVDFNKLAISEILEKFGYLPPRKLVSNDPKTEDKSKEWFKIGQSKFNLGFNQKDLKQKMKFARSKLKDKIVIFSTVKDLRVTNDGKYLFQCKGQSGRF